MCCFIIASMQKVNKNTNIKNLNDLFCFQRTQCIRTSHQLLATVGILLHRRLLPVGYGITSLASRQP